MTREEMMARDIDAILLGISLSKLPQPLHGEWLRCCVLGYLLTHHGYLAPSLAAAGVVDAAADWRADLESHGITMSLLCEERGDGAQEPAQ